MMMASSETSEQFELNELLRHALKSQYRAALAMLRQVVERCPDSLWLAGKPPFWQVAYHAAFYAHFYMGVDVAAFRAWEHHRPKMEWLGAPAESTGEPYSRAEVLSYISQIAAMISPTVDALNLASPDSGFPWYQVSKIEHQIINLRHIQHHAIYLSAALRADGQAPVKWISPARSMESAMAE